MIYLFTKREEDPSRATQTKFVVPAPDGLQFMPCQRAAIEYAVKRDVVLLADEMGIGKSAEAIGVSNALPEIQKVLIICPATLKGMWEREWQRWDVKKLSVGIVKKVIPTTNVVIVNYDILRKFRCELRNIAWDLLIADEAHYLVNKKAIRTREVLGGIKRDAQKVIIDRVKPIYAHKRLFLTGTPILSRPKDIWPLLQILDPDGLGSNWHAFAKRYCELFELQKYNPVTKKMEHLGWKWDGASNLSELQSEMRKRFMVRRLKCEVLKELPPKRRQIILLEGDKKLGKLIEAEKLEYHKWAKSDEDLDIPFGEMSKIREEIGLAKVPFVVDYLKDALNETEKIVVFARHHSTIDKLAAAFAGRVVILDGRTSIDDRQRSVDAFQQDPNVNLFIGSIKAAGVGITLVAANVCVFAELEYTPADINQSEDRLHRKGQISPVNIYHLILRGSLDEHMLNIILKKQAIVSEALDGN